MILSLLFWYVIISYLVGFLLFTIELGRAFERGQYHLMGFGIVLLLLSPLTAWHGALHYMAVYWHKLRGTPFKPWI